MASKMIYRPKISRHVLLIEMTGSSGTWWECEAITEIDRATKIGPEVAAYLNAGNIGEAVTLLAKEGYEVVVRSAAWWNETGLELEGETA